MLQNKHEGSLTYVEVDINVNRMMTITHKKKGVMHVIQESNFASHKTKKKSKNC